jgi:exocyst complex protein 7
MTPYVLNYVLLLAGYSHCLNHLLDYCESGQLENSDMTPLGHVVVMLITHLLPPFINIRCFRFVKQIYLDKF